MIIVEGWIRFAPGGLEKARAAAAGLIAATRQEAGCVSYALSADLAEPDLLRIAEIWESEAAMQAHASAPHLAQFAGALRDFGVQGLNVKAYAGAFHRQLMGG